MWQSAPRSTLSITSPEAGGGGGRTLLFYNCPWPSWAASLRCFFHTANAPYSGGRTPRSQTPGVPATPSPRQPTNVGHRGLKNSLSRPALWRAKISAKCAYKPLKSSRRTNLRNLNCPAELLELRCRCMSTGTSTPFQTVFCTVWTIIPVVAP